MPPQANEQTSLLDSLSEAGLPPMAAQHFNFRAQDSTLQQDDKKSFATIRSSTTPLIVWSLLCVSLIVVATVVGSHIGLQIANTNQQNRLSPSTQSKYKKVQGIGFQIYTGGAPAVLNETESELLNTECVGLQSYGQVVGEVAPMLQCYIGNPDPMKDVQRRIEIMTDAVEKAYELTLANNNDNSETLQVFIAPEFFWRGVTGAYAFQQDELPDDPSVCGPICQILQGMENLVAQKRFEDWIFLFGTIVASDDLPTDDPYDFLFYNFAPVYKGYDPAKHSFEGKRFLVPKRYVSSSDFLTPQRHLNETVYKQLIGEPLPQHDQTVYNPHDFDQKRYDHSMWLKYKDELNSLGYVIS